MVVLKVFEDREERVLFKWVKVFILRFIDICF